MHALNTLELKLADLYAQLPNLPRVARRWIAVNSWWIALILAIIGAIVFFAAIGALVSAIGLLGVASYISIYTNSTAVGFAIFAAAVSVVFGIISTILLFAAVSPLKAMRHRGWKLLFLNQVVAVVSAVVSFIFGLQDGAVSKFFWGAGGVYFSLIWGLIVIAAELYFLFQIRAEFSNRAAIAKEAEIVEPTAAPKKTTIQK